MAIENASFFRDFAYVFGAAVVGGMAARLLRQPLIIGYVIGGMLIGPFTPGPTVSADSQFLELLAELGVILLMYSIGIEFSARDLLRVRWVSLLGGPLGILLSVLMALGVGNLLGWTPTQSITIGAIVSVASTMVLSRLLVERGELHSSHGSVMIGMALVEDILVVILTVLLPTLATAGESGRILTIAASLGKSLLLLIPLGFAAYVLVPRLMALVAGTRSQELYLLVALALGFSTAALSQAIGLTLALGAFLAGLVISESEYAHQTLAQLLPMRDAFVALFFVTIGILIDPATLFGNLHLVLAMLGLVIVGKLVARFAIITLFGYGITTSLLAAVGLTQIGEFSFVLVQVARSAGLVGEDVYNATLATALISILLNVWLVRLAPGIAARLRVTKDVGVQPVIAETLTGHVVLCGFGRVGSQVGNALDSFKLKYVVVEVDPDIVKALRGRGIPAVYGDPANAPVLKEAHIGSAALVLITVPELDRAVAATQQARVMNPKAPILARVHRAQDRDVLFRAGATDVVQPETEASLTFIRHALDSLRVPAGRVVSYLQRYRKGIELAHEEGRPADAALPVLVELGLPAGEQTFGTIAGLHVRERFGVTILSVMRDGRGTLLNPGPNTELRGGDVIQVFGLETQIQEFKNSLTL